MVRKLVIPVVILVLTIGFVFIDINLNINVDTVSNVKYLAVNINEVEEKVETTTTSSQTGSTVVFRPTTKVRLTTTLRESIVNDTYHRIIDNTYNNLIPLHMREKLDYYGAKLIVTSDSKYVEREYGYKSAVAVTDYQKKYIIIEAANNQFNKNSLYRWKVDSNTINKYSNEEVTRLILESNVLHETGHMMDYLYAFNYSEYLHDIRLREQNNFKKTESFKIVANNTSANINSDEEYFATLFASFILYRHEFESECPESYAYIKNIFDSFYSNLN